MARRTYPGLPPSFGPADITARMYPELLEQQHRPERPPLADPAPDYSKYGRLASELPQEPAPDYSKYGSLASELSQKPTPHPPSASAVAEIPSETVYVKYRGPVN
jgi:hypothetical protein